MDRLARPRGPRARWGKLLLPGVVAAALLAGGSVYLTRGAPPSGPAAAQATGRAERAGSTAGGCGTAGNDSCIPGRAAIAVAASPVLVTIAPHRTASRAQHAKPGASASGSVPGTSPSAQPAVTGTASAQPSASAPAGTSQDSAAAGQVLALINQARASAGL